MRIYKVGVVGHRIHRFKDPDFVRQQVFATVRTLMDQYAPSPICFNINGAPGTGQWIGEAAIEYNVDYHVYCPCDPKLYSRDWYPAQADELNRQLEQCSGLTLVGQSLEKSTICGAAQSLIDNSDFIVAFWEGAKFGLTFESIKYAIQTSKIVVDGLDDLCMIVKRDLIKDKEDEE